MMERGVVVRAAALYVPLVGALVVGALRPRRARMFASCLLSVLWVVCALLVLARVNETAGWWRFVSEGPMLCGMPLELMTGWAVLWGMLPEIALAETPQWAVVVVMAGLDVVVMPLCGPVVVMGRWWLVGEAMAVGWVLVPALCVARWTLEDRRLAWRAAAQVGTSGMLFLFVLPEVVFAMRPGEGWSRLVGMAGWERQVAVQTILLLAVPGVSAVVEFVQRGGGTPIPYDPPRRLVVSGVYRFCANPMQSSCAVVMVMWALLLGNGWLVLAAGISVVYSAGIARWDEGADLETRFGAGWRDYRDAVPSWRLRWRPYVRGTPARVYLAGTCGVCSEVRRWIEARGPVGLEIVAAETLPAGSIMRIRYMDGEFSVDGVRAMGRVLEHLNAGWGFCGAVMRLPGVWQGVQAVGDVCGLGPRVVVGVAPGGRARA